MTQLVVEKRAVDQSSTTGLADRVSLYGRKEISEVIANLIAERKHWETNEFASSNKRKYQILQSCYVLYKDMVGITAEKLALKRAFNKHCEELGLEFKDSTHLMVRVVTAVFGNQDRRRVSSYAKALRIAAEKNIGSMDIPKFLSDAGGVEEVRREGKTVRVNIKEKAKVGLTLMQGKTLAQAQSDALNAEFDEAAYDGAALLMSTREVDGSFHIKYVLQNGVLITSALAHLPTLLKDKEALKAEEQKAANDEAIRAVAIKEAQAA